jgi:hypothetical protein
VLTPVKDIAGARISIDFIDMSADAAASLPPRERPESKGRL